MGRQDPSETQEMRVVGPCSPARGSGPQKTRNSSRPELPQAVLRRQQATRPGRDWSVNPWRSADGAPQEQAGPSCSLGEMKEVFPGMFCTEIGCVLQGEMGLLRVGQGRKSPEH